MEFLQSAPQEYRENVLGADLIAAVTQRFNELTVMDRYHIPSTVWETMSLEQRGEYIAHLRLTNMAAIIERHQELQRQELKKARTNGNEGEQSKPSSRPTRKRPTRKKRSRR